MRSLKFSLLVLVHVILAVILLKLLLLSESSQTNYVFEGVDENAAVNNQEHHFLDETTDRLMWFLQVSDLHISQFHDDTRIESFEYLCNNVFSLIQPRVVLATGDLTDGKKTNPADSDQIVFEWETYEKIVRTSRALRNNTVWLDIRGNHDNFNVLSRNKPNNFFRKYGMKKKFSRSYIHHVTQPNGDRYSFIGVDSAIEPGPKRPYNFFGELKDDDIDLLEQYTAMSKGSVGTVWFGHYPITTIHSAAKLRKIMTHGVAYLCGHLHNFIGLMPNMYARYPNGMLELELADWKDNRVFRMMAFDAGLFTFRDVKFMKNSEPNVLFTLITNPKNVQAKARHEPLSRPIRSTHIRFLVFAKFAVQSARVYLDGVYIGDGKRVSDETVPLYTIEWTPDVFSHGIHNIKVVVKDIMDNEDTTSHEFALDNTLKTFGFFSTLLLVNDSIFMLRCIFYACTLSALAIFLFFRFMRRRYSICISCGLVRSAILKYFRRFALLCSIRSVFYYFILSTIYTAIGPWFIGEFLTGQYGICFIWGIFVSDTFLKEDIQYLIGVWHILLFTLPLVFQLSYQVEVCFLSLNDPVRTNVPGANTSLFRRFLCWVWTNTAFIFLTFLCVIQILEFYKAYSIWAGLLNPLKTGNLCLAFWLKSKCSQLKANDFDEFLENHSSTCKHSSSEPLDKRTEDKDDKEY